LTAGASWIGLELSDYTVDEQLSSGSFSDVYLAHHSKTGAKRVFKSPKNEYSPLSEVATGWFPTRALVQVTGAIGSTKPDTFRLLRKQHEKLQHVRHKSLVTVDELVEDGSLCYYSMDFLDGKPFRTLLGQDAAGGDYKSRKQHIRLLVQLARVIDELNVSTAFGAHGDLKPENIMVSGESISIIDPGYFGPLTDQDEGRGRSGAVTTPQYYPLLEADDMLAFGLMLWETATGFQPLFQRRSSDEITSNRASSELREHVRHHELTGNYFSSAILDIPDPRELDETVSAEFEQILFKAVRIKNDGGKLFPEKGFGSFAEIAGALEEALK
jgi:Serine/threonine protein kinase